MKTNRSFVRLILTLTTAMFLGRLTVSRALNTDQDGQTDIIWHLNSGTANYSWLINGVIYITSVPLPDSPPSDWKVVGSGDFDRDSQTDLLLRTASTGTMGVWFMTNSVLKQPILLGISGTQSYYVVGTGDFNGDGISDIVWHHNTADSMLVWFMNSTGATNYSYSNTIGWFPLMGDAAFRACATGDFNNDGYTDIIWRKASTGVNVVWLMNGTNLTSSVTITSEPDANLQIVGAGHFNREGHTDLIWRNQSNGINGFWLMGGSDGLTRQGPYFGIPYLPSVTDQNWVVGGVGGYTNTMALADDVNPGAGSITLKWKPGLTTRARIERKLPSESTWTPLVSSNYTSFQYTNTGLTIGQRYEYRVDTNYIITAINDPPIESRGKVIMIVENSMTNSLVGELV